MNWVPIIDKCFGPDDFAAYVAALQFQAWRPRFCVLHNTALPTLQQWHSVPEAQRIENLQHYYEFVERWHSGPHLFISDKDIWIFTPLTVPGVHSPSWNKVSWGVELVGDYDVEEFPQSVHDNAVAALAALHKKAGLDPSSLKLHKQDPLTTHRSCPGKNVDKIELMQAVARAIA